jgi:signal transduction histidine kinase
MKIRHKIALTFAGLVSFVLLFSFSFIYYLTSHSREKDFYDLVLEKTNLTAWKYFEQDEMSANVYGKVIARYNRSLPDAEEIVLNTNQRKAVNDSLKKILPEDLIQELWAGKTIKFRIKEKQGVGIYYPDNQGTFIVIITATDKFGILQQQKLLEKLVLIFLCSAVFVFLIGQVYARNVLQPISSILLNVKRIRATNLSLRLKEIDGTDELAELTRTFNQMLERLENAFVLQKNFIRNASHELKNPLTAILGETEVTLSKQRTPEEYVVTLHKVMEEAERLDQLTSNLLSLAQTDVDLSIQRKDEIRLDELIWEIKELFDKTKYKGRIEIHFPVLPETSDLITIFGISSLMKIAIWNIIDNACKFSGNHKVDVTLKANLNTIQLRIEDKGIGIPEDEINNLFQPFFRASNAFAYRGSGIGLSLVHKIISIHNGEIKLSSVLGKGTVVEINFHLI